MGLNSIINTVRQGETVSPGVTNRSVTELDQNVKYLWEVMQAANLGSTVYARQVTVEADAAVGMPVFYNAYTQRFERALAQMETDIATGLLLTAPSAEVWGIVATKTTSTLADLLLFGYAELDISNATGGTVTAGNYYLSGVTAGGLVQQRPPVSVPVLRADGAGKVYVNTKFVEFLDSHRHYRFELWPFPAGSTTPPGAGGTHVITSGDSSQRGWLPADDPIFNGTAPALAKFGYNMQMDAQLAASWPPMPITNAYLEWDHIIYLQNISDYVEGGFQGVPLGPTGLAIIDRNGIWWLSDRYGEVPWPVAYDSHQSESFFSEFDEEGRASYPSDFDKRMAIWFTRMTLADDLTAVTSLASRDTRLKVYCAGTSIEGTTGPLELDLDLSLTLNDEAYRSPKAVKTLNGDLLELGPVAEGIYANSANVTLTGDATSTVNGKTMYSGAVGISVVAEAVRELKCMLVRLEGTTEENYPALYLGLPPTNESRYTALFEVPMDLGATGSFVFRTRLLGRTIGDIPSLTVEKMIVARPTTPTQVLENYTAVTMDTAVTLSAVNQMTEVDSEAFDVEPGDLVYIRVTRAGSDGYSGDVGVLQQVGLVSV